MLRVITILGPLQLVAPFSLGALVRGAGDGAWTVATVSHVTNSSVLLILLGGVVFLLGLISEPIAALGLDGGDR